MLLLLCTIHYIISSSSSFRVVMKAKKFAANLKMKNFHILVSKIHLFLLTFTLSKFHFLTPSQCLIIGVRKCGTRALLEMLNLHPRIQKAAGEVHFFDRDENYIKGLNWYKNKMPNTFKGQITIGNGKTREIDRKTRTEERREKVNKSFIILFHFHSSFFSSISFLLGPTFTAHLWWRCKFSPSIPIERTKWEYLYVCWKSTMTTTK